MRLLIQRVQTANIKIDNEIISEIQQGLLVFIGIHQEDSEDNVDYLVKKLVNLRIFEDENNKMNLSIKDVNGSLLLVSQFTLYADCTRGNRPDFIQAAKPEKAILLYNSFVEKAKKSGLHTETGVFAADMKINLVNDGPITIFLER